MQGCRNAWRRRGAEVGWQCISAKVGWRRNSAEVGWQRRGAEVSGSPLVCRGSYGRLLPAQHSTAQHSTRPAGQPGMAGPQKTGGGTAGDWAQQKKERDRSKMHQLGHCPSPAMLFWCPPPSLPPSTAPTHPPTPWLRTATAAHLALFSVLCPLRPSSKVRDSSSWMLVGLNTACSKQTMLCTGSHGWVRWCVCVCGGGGGWSGWGRREWRPVAWRNMGRGETGEGGKGGNMGGLSCT